MTCNRLKISSRFLRNPAEMILLTPGTNAPRNLFPVTDAPRNLFPVTDAPRNLSPVTDAPRNLSPGTDTGRNAPEKCLLLFHGAGESGQTILDNSALADMAETLNLRVALPFLGNSFGLDCGEGVQVHAFLTEELFPYLRDVLFTPSGTFCVGGISMGAHIALSVGLERRDVVSGVFSVSGAFDLRKAARFGRVCGLEIPSAVAEMEARPGEWTRRLLERHPGSAAPPLYFACGDGDLFYDANRATANRARELGYSVRWEERPGLHNWDYWRGALSDALQWVAGNGAL